MAISPAKKRPLSSVGQRLKYIRSLLHLSRAYIEERYGLPQVTLKTWENGKSRLTETGIKRCAEVFRNEGLLVSEDWIRSGIGLDPTATVSIQQYFSEPTNKALPVEDDELCMLHEANEFKEKYDNAVVMMVSNEEMRPFYKPGDYVGGRMRFEGALELAVNKDCIIHLKNGYRHFRRLIKNSNGGYNLTCLNPNENTEEPVLYNVEIEGAAPIIWHRKKDEQ